MRGAQIYPERVSLCQGVVFAHDCMTLNVSEAKQSFHKEELGIAAGQSVGSNSVVAGDDLSVPKNNHGCSETSKILFGWLSTNPMVKVRLITSMPEFSLAMCLPVTLRS